MHPGALCSVIEAAGMTTFADLVGAASAVAGVLLNGYVILVLACTRQQQKLFKRTVRKLWSDDHGLRNTVLTGQVRK
ncbi:unnamed protein product [Notodromas monacha]|uniref:Uncharacterized protein n=1 Tax=Notodromas monacha TaxID=399045 RepID=A0A7R9BTL4_9CRUS|nr:unnamed protein product [Notodromas monacha]CAG0919970.1 unnamed protein product [Notodromas monacha]